MTATAQTVDAPLFHIVAAPVWQAAVDTGSYAPPSLAAEGFVHLSYAGQVERVANARYRDVDDLVVIELDPTLLAALVRDEDSDATGELFPHLYAAVPTRAATAVHRLARDEHGDHRCAALAGSPSRAN